MEEPVMLSDTILLFDNYSESSRRLYDSFRLAGCECSVVVLENNDFLPEEAMSAYDLFLGYYGERGRRLSALKRHPLKGQPIPSALPTKTGAAMPCRLPLHPPMNLTL